MKAIYLFVLSQIMMNGVANGQVGPMIGEGVWNVLNIMPCENDEDYMYHLNITRRKIDRTHDGFNANVLFDFELTAEGYAARIDICKHVDGGCKHYQTVADDSFCNLVNKYSKANFEAVLKNGGVDPPNCPLPVKEIIVKDFVFDYNALPDKAVYGVFDAHAYLMKDGKELNCAKGTFEFKKKDDED